MRVTTRIFLLVVALLAVLLVYAYVDGGRETPYPIEEDVPVVMGPQ